MPLYVGDVLVTVLLCWASIYLGKRLQKRPDGKQVLVEKGVMMLHNMVVETMGEHNAHWMPFIGTIFLSSFFGSLIGTTQIFRSTTADLSTTLAWSVATILVVWYGNIKNLGFFGWLKSFTEPIVVLTPMNVISEIATPISMAFRHFGNVAGGGVLMTIVYAALSGLNHLVFGWLPSAVQAYTPTVFQIGIPAVLSVYFDLFSGFVQAFVFSLLSMVYIGMAHPPRQSGEVK